MKVAVTNEHIRKGEKGNIFLCPVALALNEKFGRDDAASIWFGEQSYDVSPETARRWLSSNAVYCRSDRG